MNKNVKISLILSYFIFLILSLLLCLSKFILTKYVYLVLFFYGFLIEILQFIVGRVFSYSDILYNFIVIGIGIIFYLISKKFKYHYK